MACLVVAVDKAFAMDPPAGTHESGVIPFGAIPQAFSCKIAPPVFAFLQLKFGDGGGVLDDAIPGGILGFPLLSSPFLLAVVSWCKVGLGRWVLGRGFDEVGRKDHIEGAIHDHLEDVVEGYKSVIDHPAVAIFLALHQPTLNSDFHCVEDLRWKVAVGGDAYFENYLFCLDFIGKRVDPGNKRAACAKKNGSDDRIK